MINMVDLCPGGYLEPKKTHFHSGLTERNQFLEVAVICLHRQWNEGLLNFQTSALRGHTQGTHINTHIFLSTP